MVATKGDGAARRCERWRILSGRSKKDRKGGRTTRNIKKEK